MTGTCHDAFVQTRRRDDAEGGPDVTMDGCPFTHDGGAKGGVTGSRAWGDGGA